MDFWQAQRKARSKTTLYVCIFVILTLLVAALSEVSLRTFAPQSYHPDIPILGMFFLGITFIVALYNYGMYQQYGGGYVAESVGGSLVDCNTKNPDHRQLINIMEEMALAAGLPVPPVYIIPSHEINAFAAGLCYQKAAIAITEGALVKLNREEIQGVIAHEFGHIYNGDMVISLRLAAMVMGFFFVLYLGLRLLQFTPARSKREDSKGGANPIFVGALILIIAGALTWFFGSILKACVSREREYLADACSVQFTRNPDGIVNALRKIDMDSTRDMPKEGGAYSHMYLEDHTGLSSLFATHPSIKSRISAIEGGKYTLS